MSNLEATPFVIDFRQRSANYGSNTQAPSVASVSGTNNNNNDSVLQRPSTLYCLHGQSPTHVRDHCHRQRSEGVDVKARKKLLIASVLCLVFMICEVVGGILSNSLAIATDAAHLLTDFASFMISLFAIWIAGRPSTQRMSFGWYRAEVIGALASVVMIWVITGILVWLAVERVINQNFEVDAKIMLITSGLAILVNVIMGVQLQHGHSHGGIGGHSHGAKKEKKNKKDKKQQHTIENLTAESSAIAKTQEPLAIRITEPMLEPIPESMVEPSTAESKNSQLALSDASQPIAETDAPVIVCPDSPSGRLENGITDLAAVDAELPSAGLRTFSYQHSLSVNEGNAERAAVMAETAPGAHHHGGPAGVEAVNLNVRAALIHVIGDIVQSVGVFCAALVIFFRPDWAIVDPICTFFFSVIVLFTTFAIMKDALLVLMEGTPSYMHYAEVLDIFKQIEGVERVHNLRIWALSINKVALSVHLAIGENADPKKILQEASAVVHKRYNFFETTIQIEDYTPQMASCAQCTVPIV